MSEENINMLQSIIEKQSSELAKYKEQLDYLNNIISYLPGHVYWLDKNNVYLGCNDLHAHDVNLKSRFDIVNKTNFDMPWKDQAETINSFNNYVMSTGKIATTEESAYFNNVYKTFFSQKVPLKNKTGEVIGVLGISTDITDRKKMEEDLKKAKEAAEAGEKAKTAFIANMSHDLRTPLTGIIGEAYMLKGDVTDAERIQYANELGKSGEKLLKMYNEIIEDVRSDHMSDKDIETTTLDLNELLTELKDTVQPTFTWKNLTLNIAVDPAIPVFLVSDRRKIFRIIENLVGNAMKFTDKGHINLKVDLLETQKYTIKIQVNVIDTGIGIPDNKKSQLFERFYKVSPSHKGEYEGFGLGLNIAKNYTNMLNGTIGFESTEGVGSNFYVILTIKIATEDEIATYKKKLSKPKPALLKGNETPIAESTKNSKPIKKPQIPCEETTASSVTQTPINAPHILVIEDNLVARNITVIFIKQANLNVTEATNGEAALELAKKQEFDLILADVGLPGISGIEVTQQLRQFEKEQGRKPIPIIGITAHAADGQKECIDAGMNEALAKPFTPDMLREIIKIYLPDYQNTKK